MDFISIMSVYLVSFLIIFTFPTTANVMSTLIPLYSSLIVTVAIEKILMSEWPCEIN